MRRWLNNVLRCIAEDVQRWPVLLHCTSGKDRTGVAVAVLLTALGVDANIVIEEYLLSDGEAQRAWTQQALHGIGQPARYFARVDLALLRARVSA